MNKRKGREWKKEKQRKVNIHFLHSLLHFTVFSFFFHFPLTLLPPSLSCFSLSHFPTLLWNPIHRFLSFHSLNLFFLQSESLGFLLSLAHFHYNSSERFSANPRAFLLKKRDKEISTAVPLWNYYVLSRGTIARSDLTVWLTISPTPLTWKAFFSRALGATRGLK